MILKYIEKIKFKIIQLGKFEFSFEREISINNKKKLEKIWLRLYLFYFEFCKS